MSMCIIRILLFSNNIDLGILCAWRLLDQQERKINNC